MTGARYSRHVAVAVSLALLLVPTCIAVAKTKDHKPTSHKPRCKPRYVAKRVRVRKRDIIGLYWFASGSASRRRGPAARTSPPQPRQPRVPPWVWAR